MDDEASLMRNRHEETMLLIRNYLEGHAMTNTVQALDTEKEKLSRIEAFNSLLMGGAFEQAVTYLFQLQKHSSISSCQIVYKIWRRYFFELLSVGNRNQATNNLYTVLYSTSRGNDALVNDYGYLEECLKSNIIPTLESSRDELLVHVEHIIEEHEDLKSLFYPTITEEQNRLQTLLEQSLNWQHRDCQHSTASASLLADHHCNPQLLYQNQNMTYQTLANNYTNLNASSSGGGEGFSADPMRDELISYQPPQQSPPVYLELDSDHFSVSDLLGTQPDVTALPSFSLSDNVEKRISVSDIVTAFEFHPHLPLVLVCTDSGDVRLYRINGSNTPFRKKFTIWKLRELSNTLKAHFGETGHTAGGLCVAWGSDTRYAVGFSEGLVQTYNYVHERSPTQHLEIEAHSGPVNDMVFYSSQGELKLVTCGDDKYIRAWNLSNRSIYWQLAHTAPLNSLALHQDGNTVQLFTSDVFGTVLKPNLGVHNGQPHLFLSVMNGRFELKFSSDGKRLFCCGLEPSIQGSGSLVELDIQSLTIRRDYKDFNKTKRRCIDTCNGYIAVGDEYCVKVWSVDSDQLFKKIRIDDSEFLECPMVKFNREGTLLCVVSANCIRILANDDGRDLLR